MDAERFQPSVQFFMFSHLTKDCFASWFLRQANADPLMKLLLLLLITLLMTLDLEAQRRFLSSCTPLVEKQNILGWTEQPNEKQHGQSTFSPFPFSPRYVTSGEGETPLMAVWRPSVRRTRKKKCWLSCSYCGRNSVTTWGRRRSSLQQRYWD